MYYDLFYDALRVSGGAVVDPPAPPSEVAWRRKAMAAMTLLVQQMNGQALTVEVTGDMKVWELKKELLNLQGQICR